MLEKIFGNARNVLHGILVPVVHAQETKTNQTTDESVWDRLIATTYTK